MHFTCLQGSIAALRRWGG